MYSDMPSDDVQLVPRTYSEKVARWKSYLSGDERLGKIKEENRFECANAHVQHFLRRCEERRAKLPQPPKRIAWGNRPKWNGVITN